MEALMSFMAWFGGHPLLSLQHPVGYKRLLHAMWETIQGHKFQEAEIVRGP